jgi:hypothetical protein
MKKNTDTAMTTATELLAERRRYEAWLAALHDRRESTPAHVFTRVLADYEARLEAVVSQLKSKADALDSRVAELVARASALEDDARAVQDQRAEAELRAHVGELEGAAWEKAAQEADARLAVLAEERTAVDAELGSIRDLLGAARKPTPAAAGRAVPATDAPDASGAAAPAAADAKPTNAPTEVQHDAFAASAEAAAGGDAPLVSDASAAEPVPAARPSRSTGSFDELAFLRDVTGEGAKAASASPLAPPRQATLPMAEPTAPSAPAAPPAEPELELEPQPAPERPIKDTLGLVLPGAALAALEHGDPHGRQRDGQRADHPGGGRQAEQDAQVHRLRLDELSHGVVLRAVRSRAVRPVRADSGLR